MSMNFFDTVAGHNFASHTIPELANQIEGLNYNLSMNQNKKIYVENVIVRNVYDNSSYGELNSTLEGLEVVDIKTCSLGGGAVLYTILHRY